MRAVLVTAGKSGFFADAVAALAAQDHQIDAWHIVNAGGGDDAELSVPEGADIGVSHVKARTFGEAVSALLATVEPEADERLWLLHDDCAPAPNALRKLLAATRKRRSAAVFGAAQTRWDDGSKLVNIGVTVSRLGGRRLSLVEQDDLDQGQHEGREDVLAVGLAGALVTRAVWDKLGGTDPAYGKFGDSAEFCRRVWRAGHDVVVVPGARVRHAQAALYGRKGPSDAGSDHRGAHAQRRAAEWYHAMAWSPVWAVPLIAVWAAVSAVSRAVFRIASNDLRLVTAELRAPVVVAARMRRLGASRKAVATAGKREVERPLLASALDIARHVRTRELGAYERWRAQNTPTDVQESELRAIARRRRWAFGGLGVVLVALSIALFGTWFTPLAGGDMLTGSSLGATDVSTSELWLRTWTGWSESALGGPALDGSWAGLMLPLSLVPGGLSMGVGLLLALGPLLAGVGAWFAAGAATRSVVARGFVAIAWAAWPAYIQSISDGRLGAAIAHIALPLFALALARAVAAQRRDLLGDGAEFPASRIGSPSAAAVAAGLMAVVTIAAPILLAPLVIGVLVLGVVATGHRRYVFTVPVPAVIIHGAALWNTWQARGSEAWAALLVREPGPALASDLVDPWQLLLGVAQLPPEWTGATASANVALAYLAGVMVVAAALAALAGKRAATAVRVGWAVAAVGLAAAVLAHRTIAVYAAGDGSAEANGWPGPGLSLMALGFLGAAAVGAGSARTPAPGQKATAIPEIERRIARAANVAAAGFVAAILVVHVAATIWPGRGFGGDVHPASAAVLPLVAQLEQQAPPLTRVVVLWEDDGVVRYSVVSRDGWSALPGRGFLDAEGHPASAGSSEFDLQAIAPVVAALAGAAGDAAVGLNHSGIGVVVVAPESDAVISAMLRVDGLSLIGSSERGVSWRVAPAGASESDDAARVARAWLQSEGDGVTPLDSSPVGLVVAVPMGAADRMVVLAAAKSDAWVATLDGHALVASDVNGNQAFAVGADSGELEIRYYDSSYRAWWWAGLLALAWSLINAIPLQNRRFRKERA